MILFALSLLALMAPASAAPAPRPAAAGQPVRLTIQPAQVKLSGRGTSQRFLVFGEYADGRKRDLTSTAKLSTSGPPTVTVQGNRATAALNGAANVVASVGALKAAAKVTVQDAQVDAKWSFANDVVPIFTKAGCNTGGCHGSPSGRGGFRLSLFGYEPDYDYERITADKNGGRINKNRPQDSLLLKKPTMQTPHGGGMRFKPTSPFYAKLIDWLKSGAPRQELEFDTRMARIEIYPKDWTLDRAGQAQQVLVMAVRDDGSTQDVTQYARFSSNNDAVAEVDDEGVITAAAPGETSVMIRYLGGVGVVRVKVPRPPLPAAAFANFTPANYIDQHVLAKLKEVRIPPSDPAADSEFLRRAYIDTCGITPSVDEARRFLDDKDPQKRAKLIDSLLERPEFVDYWTLKWSDLLRNNSQAKQGKGLQVFYRWLRENVRANKPYDQFARELITATGSGFRSGPVNWYVTGEFGADYPLYLASQTSQVFLGLRIDCARCHNHPFEAWSQMDYYRFAAFFARTKNKRGPDENEEIIFAANTGDLKPPRLDPKKDGQVVEPKYLGDMTTVDFQADEDRREALARWITSSSNPWFKRAIANRLWNNFMGRGIVQPVDDVRLTNPASNDPLLDAMAEKAVQYKFNLKGLMRDILMSRAYQTTSVANKLNAEDRTYASHALPRRLYAEVLLDALVYATDVPEKFGPYEYGRRAISIPDNRVGSEFLDLFGRAKREVACECERSEETNVSMVLNLLTGGTVNGRITHPQGRVARAVNAKKPPKEIIEEFYLATLARRPTAKEEALALGLFQKAPNSKEGAEDLMWALLNMKEFLFNH